MRGIRIDVRHSTKCPRYGQSAEERQQPTYPANGRRACRCAPRVRIRLHHGEDWMPSVKLSEGWTAAQLTELAAKAEAERAAVDAGYRVAAPTARREVPTVAEWGRECLAKIRQGIDDGAEDAFAPSTYIAYRGLFRKHIAPTRADGGIGDLRLTAVTFQVVDDLRRDKLSVLARSSAEQLVYMLRAMFAEAIVQATEHGWPLDDNPARVRNRGLGRRQPKRQRADLDKDRKAMPLEVARLLLRRYLGTGFGELLALGLTTGMRQAEIAGVYESSLYLGRKRLYVENQIARGLNGVLFIDKSPKYESFRWVPLYSPVAAMLMPHDGGSSYVFIDPLQRAENRPWQVRKMSVMLSAAWDALVDENEGLPPRGPRQGWHACRHLYSNLLDRGGIRPMVRKSVLGHVESGMNAVYLEVDDVELDAVEPVLDRAFGDIFSSVGQPGISRAPSWR